MSVLRDFRALVGAAQGIERELQALAASQETDAALAERVEQLELSRRTWEADVEGTLLKAEGKLAAANNAEARTRTMKKSYEKLHPLADFDGEGEEVPTPVPTGHAEGGEVEGLQPLRVDVAPDYKALGARRKFA